MTIIADSGSTKTSWAATGTETKTITEGLNPLFTTDETFLNACREVSQQFKCQEAETSVIFYGAGCGNTKQRNRTKKLLQEAFSTDDVTVETDMLGACRATAGNEAGIVAILGTGSNTCYYDGKTIRHKLFSMGYILGDEGSANHLGALLLRSFLSDNMPTHLSDLFEKKAGLTKEQMLEKLYCGPNPNRWLASLAPFATENKKDDFCDELIRMNIDHWIAEQVDPLYEKSHCKKLFVVGGFANATKTILKEQLSDRGYMEASYSLKKVVANPIDNLVKYHSQT